MKHSIFVSSPYPTNDVAHSPEPSLVGQDELPRIRREGVSGEHVQRRPGLLIVALDGRRIRGWEEVLQYVGMRPDTEIRFTVEREGQRIDLEATTEARTEYNKIIPRARGEALQTIQQAEGYYLERVNEAWEERPEDLAEQAARRALDDAEPPWQRL